MSHLTTHWLDCKLTKARLASVEHIMEKSIMTSNAKFKDLALHTVRMGGKKIRPSLYLLALNTGAYYESDLLIPAAALELIHVASLHHDDVMDKADKRRNTISVNAKWGNLNATYSGNYLFSKAIAMLSQYNKRVNQITCQYISDLCLGQLKEAESAYSLECTYENHIDILAKKTASLFELPCKLGALLSDANNEVLNALTLYSHHLGIGFQLIDDLLDLKGDPSKTGKVPGTDLKEGVYTYAVLYTLKETEYADSLKDILAIEDMENEHLTTAIKLITKGGGLDVAKYKAVKHIHLAIDALSILPENTTKRSLLKLAKFILSRDH